MLSVILIILRTAGLCVLVLLVLLLVLLVLFLTVPIRYSFSGRAAKEKEADLRVSWFFRLFRLHLRYLDGLSGRAEILWFPVWQLKGEETEACSRDAAEPDAAAEAVEAPEAADREAEVPETISGEVEVPEAADEGAGAGESEAPEPAGSAEACEASDGRVTAGGAPPDWTEKPASGRSRGKERLSEKLMKKKAEFDRLSAFLKEESTVRLERLLLKKLRRILKEILPQKMSGEIRYGAEDPAAVGKFAEAAALLMPLLGERVRMVPEFDQEELFADLTLSGRIRLYVPAFTAVSIWFDRDFQKVRRTYRRFKRRKRGRTAGSSSDADAGEAA